MTRKRPRNSATVSEFRQSMVQVRIGSRTYDAVYQTNCHTCTHPARMLIEEKILQNFSFRAIAEQYSEKMIEGEGGRPISLPRIGHMSIYNHFHNGHMPLEAATLRKMAERRARQIGHQYEEAVEQFVDHMVLAEATIARVYDRMVKGEIEPEVRDGLAAAKLMADVEAEHSAGLDSEAWSEAMSVYFETARHHMDEQTWARFTADLQVNPILRALERRLNPGMTVDGDVAGPLPLEGAS